MKLTQKTWHSLINYYTFPRKSIATLTGYDIKENKRNYRKQEEHLNISRYIRDLNNPKWDVNAGRKSKQEPILTLYEKGTRNEKEIAKKLNIRIETVKKHLKEAGVYEVKKKGGQSKEIEVKDLIKKYPNESLNKLSKISGIDTKTIKKYSSK